LEAAPNFPAPTDHEDIFAPPEETDDLFGRSDAPQIEMPSDPSAVVPSPPAPMPPEPGPPLPPETAPPPPEPFPAAGPEAPDVEPSGPVPAGAEVGLTPDPAPASDAAFAQFPAMQFDSPSATALAPPPAEAAPSPWLTPAPAGAPAGTELPSPPPLSARAAAAQAAAGRRGVSVWIVLPLVSYSLLATAALVFLWNRSQSADKNQNPLELYLPDGEGDKPGVVRTPKKLSDNKKKAMVEKPLPEVCLMRLGETRTVGALAVTPESVRWHKIGLAPAEGEFDAAKNPLDRPALVLHLRLRNVSEDQTFQPLDRYFDRQWRGKGPPPLTLLEAGEKRFYGGPAEWHPSLKKTVRGDQPHADCVSLLDVPDAPRRNAVDQPLGPGEEVEAFVCTDPQGPDAADLARSRGDFLWRVHLRRGLVEVRGEEVPAAAVLGVEFTDRDVGKGG
jgi:hypothetical protein